MSDAIRVGASSGARRRFRAGSDRTVVALTGAEFSPGWWAVGANMRTNQTATEVSVEFRGTRYFGPLWSEAFAATTRSLTPGQYGARVYPIVDVASPPSYVWSKQSELAEIVANSLDPAVSYRADIVTAAPALPLEGDDVISFERWWEPGDIHSPSGMFGGFLELAGWIGSPGLVIEPSVTRSETAPLRVLVFGDSNNDSTTIEANGSLSPIGARDAYALLAARRYAAQASKGPYWVNPLNHSYGGYHYTTIRFPRFLGAQHFASIDDFRAGISTPSGAPARPNYLGPMLPWTDPTTMTVELGQWNRLTVNRTMPGSFVPQLIIFAMGQNDGGLVDLTDEASWEAEAQQDLEDLIDLFRATWLDTRLLVVAPHTDAASLLGDVDRVRRAMQAACTAKGWMTTANDIWFTDLKTIVAGAPASLGLFGPHFTPAQHDWIAEQLWPLINTYLDVDYVPSLDFSDGRNSMYL